MPETLTHPVATAETEAKPRATAFKTAKGSIYRYDADGKTTRFKAATGEQMERQDVTVFADFGPEDEQSYKDALHAEGAEFPSKVYVVERQPDDSSLIVRDVAQVRDPNRLYLVIMKNGQMLRNNPVSLEPVEGALVFDTRQFVENGQVMTERHLGNKVAEIAYS